MIIGIDYRFAVNSIRGIGYYVKSIVNALSILDQTNTYYLYVDQKIQLSFPTNFNIVVIDCKNLILFEQYHLPKRAKKDGIQLLWYPSNSGPIFLTKNSKLVVTIHDLVSLNYKLSIDDFFKWKNFKSAMAEKYRALFLKLGLKRIKQLITVSEFSALQIQKQLYRKAKVIVNHSHPLKETESGKRILNKLSIKAKNYIYALAGPGKHKNLKGYFELFKHGEVPQILVISGVIDLDLMERYHSDFIIFTGEVTEAEKASLYANASAFLCLSYHEGFGLPILEAMQFQIPIISSNKGALPMVLGDAGTLIDPDNQEKVRKELKLAIEQESEIMKKRQREQYAKFSDWCTSAKEHLDLFMSLREER